MIDTSKCVDKGWYWIRTVRNPFAWQAACWNGRAFWVGQTPWTSSALEEVHPDRLPDPPALELKEVTL